MTSAQFDTWLADPDRRPLVMGVLNVTPDSFSDGGKYSTPAAAIEHGRIAGKLRRLFDIVGCARLGVLQQAVGNVDQLDLPRQQHAIFEPAVAGVSSTCCPGPRAKSWMLTAFVPAVVLIVKLLV